MFIINYCLNMFRASLCPSLGEQRPCYCIWCVVLVLLDVVGSGCGALRNTPYVVTHGLCSPEDGYNDARNMMKEKLIINICLLHLVGFFSLFTLTHSFASKVT